AGMASRSPAAEVGSMLEWLAGVDVDALDDHERVALVAGLERLKGGATAAQARAVDALREAREASRPQDAARSVGSEVALARRQSPTLGDRFVGLSRVLVHEMPMTMAALTRGDIGERHAVEVARETATLSLEDRAEVDARLADTAARLSPRALGRAARRVAAELDAAAVVRRMEAAAASRRVSVRPAPDGMAYLTVLAPLREAVGAYATLRSRAQSVLAGQAADEQPDGRGLGAVMADTALRLMSGRAAGQVQSVEVHLVITDRALLGTGDPTHSVNEPGRIPGHGPVPAPVARTWIRHAGEGSVWLRRLYTSPDGRDLVAMDARRRCFTGLLRRMLVLRDDTCATPWCDAPITHADHTHPARDSGPTEYENGSGLCARCTHVKEAPGWRVHVVRGSPRQLRITTPTGHRHHSLAPPLLGWGSDPPAPPATADSPLERHLRALLEGAA
ncbi:MAG TPA: DUF222 domain-containing protein, partial [Phycicoccus sp.]